MRIFWLSSQGAGIETRAAHEEPKRQKALESPWSLRTARLQERPLSPVFASLLPFLLIPRGPVAGEAELAALEAGFSRPGWRRMLSRWGRERSPYSALLRLTTARPSRGDAENSSNVDPAVQRRASAMSSLWTVKAAEVPRVGTESSDDARFRFRRRSGAALVRTQPTHGHGSGCRGV